MKNFILLGRCGGEEEEEEDEVVVFDMGQFLQARRPFESEPWSNVDSVEKSKNPFVERMRKHLFV